MAKQILLELNRGKQNNWEIITAIRRQTNPSEWVKLWF